MACLRPPPPPCRPFHTSAPLPPLPRPHLLLMSCNMAAKARDTSKRTAEPATSRKFSGEEAEADDEAGAASPSCR